MTAVVPASQASGLSPKASDRLFAPPSRVVIEAVAPAVDGGRFPAKRVVGDAVTVEADIFADGHESLEARLLWRAPKAAWQWVAMEPLGNDRWRAAFVVDQPGRYDFTIEASIDSYGSWLETTERRAAAGELMEPHLRMGAALVQAAATARTSMVALHAVAHRLKHDSDEDALTAARDVWPVMREAQQRNSIARYHQVLQVEVDRIRARSGAWYEFFPRSCGPVVAGVQRHGTFANAEARLEYVAAMGFDVVYLPPIHPIGRTHRKGPNNVAPADGGPHPGPNGVGSPWAIGSQDGGHTAIHPELGTLEDFHRFLRRAAELGLEVALDLAFQCSPDHPWVDEHPEWFRHLPDGSVAFAENPPKKYEDIVPLNFDTPHWQELWEELAGVVSYWVDQGIRIFRVDNPHTKPFPFWEWLIARTRSEHPDVIFLAEAFTRPAVMSRLAKIGFSQSYTYFTWRNTPDEFRTYLRELTQPPMRDYFRPNFWPNTPDILTADLQRGGKPAFAARLALAATLSPSYGVYGPAFELLESTPAAPDSEEYLNSEKYQLRTWAVESENSLSPLLTKVNAIRRDHPALWAEAALSFHPSSNDQVLAYSKATADGLDRVFVVVNFDPTAAQTASIDLSSLIGEGEPWQAEDLLNGGAQTWRTAARQFTLEPGNSPVLIFSLNCEPKREPAV